MRKGGGGNKRRKRERSQRETRTKTEGNPDMTFNLHRVNNRCGWLIRQSLLNTIDLP